MSNIILIDTLQIYSGTPLVRPPLLHQKRGLSRRGGLSSGVKINTFMFTFALSSGLSRGGGLLSVWPPKRGSTVFKFFMP